MKTSIFLWFSYGFPHQPEDFWKLRRRQKQDEPGHLERAQVMEVSYMALLEGGYDKRTPPGGKSREIYGK